LQLIVARTLLKTLVKLRVLLSSPLLFSSGIEFKKRRKKNEEVGIRYLDLDLI
jgi:hypothetical protein